MAQTRRDVSPDEMVAIHKLALRVPDLRQVEPMLDELERLRAKGNVLPLPGQPTPEGPSLHGRVDRLERASRTKHTPLSADHLLKLKAAGVVTDEDIREVLGLRPRLTEAPEVVEQPARRNLLARAGWGLTWRLTAMAGIPVLALLAIPPDYTWTVPVAALAVGAVGITTRWLGRRGLLGSITRLLLVAGIGATGLVLYWEAVLLVALAAIGAAAMLADTLVSLREVVGDEA